MSLNGISEAFVNATANEVQLRRLSLAMVALSVIYVPAAAAALTYGGSAGLVIANVANLGAWRLRADP